MTMSWTTRQTILSKSHRYISWTWYISFRIRLFLLTREGDWYGNGGDQTSSQQVCHQDDHNTTHSPFCHALQKSVCSIDGLTKNFVGRDPFLRVFGQHSPHQIFCLFRDSGPRIAGEIQFRRFDGLEDPFVTIRPKRGDAWEQNVKNHSRAPDVGLRTVLFCQHFGS